jgi:hypothetical protein
MVDSKCIGFKKWMVAVIVNKKSMSVLLSQVKSFMYWINDDHKTALSKWNFTDVLRGDNLYLSSDQNYGV